MYAIFKHGGKQYKAEVGDILKLDKMNVEPKDSVELNEVLAINDKELRVGTPFIEGAKVVLNVINSGKDKKVIIFKTRRRKDSKLKKGFRRLFTRVRVAKIIG